jgi:hypothetical protein
MTLRLWAAGALTLTLAGQALAQTDNKYNISQAEVSACQIDAVRLCSGALPDQDQLVACMKKNRASLGADCGRAFDAGMKRRHL